MRNFKLLCSLISMCAAFNASATPPTFSLEVQAKLAPFVLQSFEKNLAAETAIPVIVKMKKQADLKAIEDERLPLAERQKKVYDSLRTLAIEDQKGVVQFLKTKRTRFRRFYISNMIAVWDVNAALIKKLAERSDVEKIYGNPTVRLRLPSVVAGVPVEENARKIGDNITYLNADRIWKKYGKQGEGIVVAGQDTGVQFNHPALEKQYRGFTEGRTPNHDLNWHDSVHRDTPIGSNRCGYDLKAPCDDDDHGSHTMGTMVGSEGEVNQIGMAPKAKWIACRNMDGGAGTPASYIECFEWFLAPYRIGANPMTDGEPGKAPNIINNSWGCPEEEGCSTDEIAPSLVAMRTAGILVVVSAGNDGPDCMTIQDPPAWHSALTLGVGAYDHRSGKIAEFSSRGPSKIDGQIGPDLVAPGVNIRSSITNGEYAGIGWSGTSMAGPHIAGAAALLWSIHPELIGEIDRTSDLLMKSATAKTSLQKCGGVSGSSIPNNTFGMGVLNLQKALNRAAGVVSPSEDEPKGSSWPNSSSAL